MSLEVASAKVREWREKPALFVREVFGVTPDAWQDEVLEAFPTHQRIALKACKGPGKSAVESWVGWNFLFTRPHPKVVATSISGANLRDNLWAEFAKWQGRSELLKKAFTWSASRIVANDHPETWWASAREWAKSADPQAQADTLAGIHADYVLFLIDEAGGIPDGVVATAEAGLSTGIESKMFISGNPTHLSGPLYRACTRERKLWFVREISSAPEDPKRTPRVSAKWAQEQIDKYGRDNPWVLVNVFGQFPPGQSNALLAIDDVTAAARRTITPAEYEADAKVLGVDVARFGDDRTCFTLRQGRVGFRTKVFRNLDTMEVAGQLADFIALHKPDATFIDQTGIGAGVVDRCRQLGLNVVGVDFGSKALGPRYANRRAEMWGLMADWVKRAACLPDDDELISELVAPTYSFNPSGKLLLESKQDLKDRGVPSPDKADSLALTFAMPVTPRDMRGPLAPKRQAASLDFDPYKEKS